MSAIWGSVNGSAFSKMTEYYKQFCIDRIEEITENEVAFGCGIQYFTPEAEKEILPLFDAEKKIIFTADAVIDNRNEVIQKLGIVSDPEEISEKDILDREFLDITIPDGRLLFEAYKKWGSSFTDYVVGAFACGIYNIEEKELKLYTDHMGNRSLFYSIANEKIYFGTTPESVYLCNPIGVNEKFLVAYLALDFSEPNIFPKETPYGGVYQILAGTEISWKNGKVNERSYYSPDVKAKKYHLSEEKYKELFVATLREAVESMIRTNGEVGCTLSSGLDSTSIACLAAPFLKKQNKALNSFTSVPLKDYVSDLDEISIADESEGVKIVAKAYDNIKANFVDCEGMDGLSELGSNTKKVAYPTKSGHNLTWLNEIYGIAAQKGIKLMLKGQYGNTTISYGRFLTVYYQLLRGGRPLEARRQRKIFQKRYHVPTKYIREVYKKELEMRKTAGSDLLKESRVRSEYIKKYDLDRMLREDVAASGGGEIDSWEERICFMYSPQGMMILGLNDTMMSLQYGILIRDPSKDVRLVNLLTHYPIECVLADGWERGMVRSYMRGIVPDEILNNVISRGLQSADMKHRLKKYFDGYRKAILSYLAESPVDEIFREESWKELLNAVENEPADGIDATMQARISNSYAASIFIKDIIGKYN